MVKETLRELDQYEHTEQERPNNPPANLVSPQNDPVTAEKKTYAYDPHLDPQLMWAGKADQSSQPLSSTFGLPQTLHRQAVNRIVADSVGGKHMATSELPLDFTQVQTGMNKIAALRKEIERLDQKRADNLPKLRTLTAQVVKAAEDIGDRSPVQSILAWAEMYRGELDAAVDEAKKALGRDLDRELGRFGLKLGGNYPLLRAGWYHIEVDFERWVATLWYGPQQEKLAEGPLSAPSIAKHVASAQKQSGSRLSEKDFVARLRQAYRAWLAKNRGKDGDDAPIIPVLVEMAVAIQGRSFLLDPRGENFKGYGRADFSRDLFRFRGTPGGPQLRVAVMRYSQERKDYLWVPSHENGEGSRYSHLHLGG